MVNGITFEEDLRARLEQARKEELQEQSLADQYSNKAKQRREYADALEKFLSLHTQQNKSKNIHGLTNTQLQQQSTWDNLKSIIEAKNGLLIVKEAVDFLVDMKVFADKEHASNLIYSTLNNHKKDVVKIRQGIYRLNNSTETNKHDTSQIELIQLKNPMSFKTGVIKVLKEAHGEALHSKEIWHRMQNLGIMSNASDPSAWVDIHARKNGAILVAPRTWLLKDNALTNNIQANHEQTVISVGVPSVRGIIENK